MEKTKKITTGEKLLFAFGDLFGGGGQALIGVLYFFFLSNIIGIGPGWAGTVVMVSKIWDAINDPLMGLISDNARTKMGRRRPFILIGGVLLVGTYAILWAPISSWTSDTAKIIYSLISYFWYSTFSAFVDVPYSSMSAEIADEPKERNSVNLIRLVFSTISTAICTLLPSILLTKYTNGEITLNTFYLILVFGFGICFAIPLILIGLFTKERVVLPKEKEKFDIRGFVRPLGVKSFRQLVGMYLSQSISMDILSNGIILYALYCFTPKASSTIFLGIFIGVQLLMFPVIQKLINKVDKNKLYYFGLPVALVAIFVVTLYPAGWPIIGAYIATGILAIGFAGAQLTSWLIFPDAVDAGELKLGQRNTGSFSGIMTFIRKMSSAIAIWLFGIILSITGYVKPVYPNTYEVQPAEAILGIRLVMLVAFFLLMLAAYFLARKFVLTKENSAKTRKFLAMKHDGTFDTMSAADKAEYDDLAKKIL